MRIIFLLVFVIIRVAFCGYTTKAINESKGYSGGFLMGVLLVELGILIAVFKKELPDAPPNSYRVVPVVNVLKKYHYPFVSPQVEPIDILKGNIYAEAEAGKVNIVFYLIHSLFLMLWYSTILGAYLWYVMGYTVYWLFKYKLFKKGTAEDSVNTAGNVPSIKDSVIGGVGSLKERAGSTASKLSQKTEGVKTDAVEKAALAKEKAGAALAGLKGKAAALAADRKKAVDGDTPDDKVIADENFPVEEAYSESEAVTATADYNEEVSDAESFDELYEKAMNTADDEESYDEAASLETDTEDSYNEETVNEVKEPVDAPSVDPTSAPPTSAQPKPAPRQFSYESDTPDDEGFADENFPVEEAYSESDIVRDTADYNEEVSDAESFDKLYKKAMDSFDDEESYDEAASLETDTEDSYNEETVNEVKEPVDAPSVDPTPAPPTSAQPKPAPRQFSYEEEKKTPVVFVLVGVIAVQLIGVGILGGMLLMKNKDDDPGKSEKVRSEVTATTGTAEEAAETSVTTEAVTVEETSTETVTEPRVTEPAVSEEAFNSALDAFLASFGGNSSAPISDTQYALYDVNGDGIKELFVKAEYIAGHYTTMYQLKNGSFIETEASGESVKICTENALIECDRFGGGVVYAYYSIDNSKNVVLSDQLYSYVNWYYHGESEISEAEFNSLLAEKNRLSWLEPSYTYFTPKNQAAGYSAPSSVDYHSDHRSGAGSDFLFAEFDGAGGLIATERDPLNLRSKPDPNAEIIVKMPKDSNVGILGSNSDWYYIHYTENGISYYGYASRKYVRNLQAEAKMGNSSQSVNYHTDHRSGAGPDFTFAASNGYGGTVATDSGSLNLRARPDANSEIIASMPKGSLIGIYGSNSDWYYVEYTENGVVYYGYASQQFIIPSSI